MPLPTVSTFSLYFGQRLSTQSLTRQLAKANAELSGWKADAGLDLGASLAKSTALRNQITSLDSQINSNKLIGKQLKTQQTVLDNIRANADAMMKTLISFSDGKIAANTIREEAASRLDALLGSLNTPDERRYLLGGSNTGTPPMKPYDGAPKAALDAAFQA